VKKSRNSYFVKFGADLAGLRVCSCRILSFLLQALRGTASGKKAGKETARVFLQHHHVSSPNAYLSSISPTTFAFSYRRFSSNRMASCRFPFQLPADLALLVNSPPAVSLDY